MTQTRIVAPIILSLGAGIGGMSTLNGGYPIAMGRGNALACDAPSDACWSSSSMNDRQKFKRLAAQWRKQTMHFSSAQKMSMDESYQQIIGMGSKALPFLFQSLERQPEHWFWALHMITGANPVPQESRGKLAEMSQAWIEWGRVHGYVSQ